MRTVVAALVLLALTCIFVRTAMAADVIHVEVVSLHNSTGQVGCSLYPAADGFPNTPDKALKNMMVPIKDNAAVCDFADIPKGTYAVAVFHDEDSDGKLEFNFLGIPKEGVGASNDAQRRMRPPKFKEASFDYTGGREDLRIHVKYLL
jgi:uncharacterized protein (DUF2141 family)